jgi:hypothetical protein
VKTKHCLPICAFWIVLCIFCETYFGHTSELNYASSAKMRIQHIQRQGSILYFGPKTVFIIPLLKMMFFSSRDTIFIDAYRALSDAYRALSAIILPYFALILLLYFLFSLFVLLFSFFFPLSSILFCHFPFFSSP